MQLRYYLAIVRRFWPLVVALPLLVGLISLIVALREPPGYTANAELIVTQALPDTPYTPSPTELRDQWGGTEYVIDDLSRVVGSALFAQDVSAVLSTQGVTLDPSSIPGSLSVTTLHRSVTIQGVASAPDTAKSLVEAAVQTLRTNGLKYWGLSGPRVGPGINVIELSPPEAATSLRSARRLAATIGLRVALGLAAGVGLAFLLHYLDTTLREPSQVEQGVGIPVIGVIPRE